MTWYLWLMTGFAVGAIYGSFETSRKYRKRQEESDVR